MQNIELLIIKILAISVTAGCVDSTIESTNKNTSQSVNFGVSEAADFSTRTAYFSSLSTGQLCTFALQIEGTPPPVENFRYVDPFLVGNGTPFIYLDGELSPLTLSKSRQGVANSDLAMRELSNRYEGMRVKICPVLSEMSGKAAMASGVQCVTDANSITPDDLCPGSYGGKPFSVAIIDAAVRRQQLYDDAWTKAQESNRNNSGAVLRCRSTEAFGTVSTTCY